MPFIFVLNLASDQIQLGILLCQVITTIIIGLYTWFTYRLFAKQRDLFSLNQDELKIQRSQIDLTQKQLEELQEQFRLSNRPWIEFGNVRYIRDRQRNRLEIPIRNHGKLPAMMVTRADGEMKLTQPKKKAYSIPIQNMLYEQVNLETDSRREILLPYIPNDPTNVHFEISVSESLNALLIDSTIVEVSLRVYYKTHDSKSDKDTYHYFARVVVEDFRPDLVEQNTNIYVLPHEVT